MKKSLILPKFKNEEEERKFWDKIDLSEYFEPKDFKHASFPNLKMSNFWFVTWNRSEYKEWAQKKNYGYLLTIIRKQPQDFLVVKAKLIFKAKNLPAFETIKSVIVKTEKEAKKLVKNWQGPLTAIYN